MPEGKGLSGRMVLAILVLSFAIVVGVNATFVVLSITSFPGEEEAKSYAQGLEYNSTLSDRRAQAELGWRASAGIIAGAHPVAQVVLRDASGRPVEGARISGVLRRPTQAALDHTLIFTARGAGAYEAALPALADGQWDLVARATRAGAHFDLERRLVWESPRS